MAGRGTLAGLQLSASAIFEFSSKVFFALHDPRFRCVHDPGSADELPPVRRSKTQGAAQEAAGDVL